MKKLLSVVLLVLPLLFFSYGCDKSQAITPPSLSNNSSAEMTSVIEADKPTEEVKEVAKKSVAAVKEATNETVETATEATEETAAAAVTEVTKVAMSPAHDGGKIFKANCAACHAGGVNRIVASKSLKKDALMQYDMYSQEAIVYQVTNGKNAMPPFKGRLSPEEIQTVASYVLQQADNGWS